MIRAHLSTTLLLLSALLMVAPACSDETEGSSGTSSVDANLPTGTDANSGQVEGDTTTPEEDATTPEEDATTPEEDTTPPEEDATTPEEDTTAPEEDTATPEEDTATPEEDVQGPEALLNQPIDVSEGFGYVSGELYAMAVDASYRVVIFWRGDNQDGTDDLLVSSSDPLVEVFSAPYVLKPGVQSLPITSGGDMIAMGPDLLFTWRDRLDPCAGLDCGASCSNCSPEAESCFDQGAGKVCDPYGGCVPATAVQCDMTQNSDCADKTCGSNCNPCVDLAPDETCDAGGPHTCGPNKECLPKGTYNCSEALSGNGLVMFRRTSLPGLEGEDIIITETPPGTELWRPHVVADGNGQICVLWQQDKSVRIRCSGDGGVTWGDKKIVSSESSSATISDAEFMVDGTLLVAYQEQVNDDVQRIQTVLSTDLGATWSFPVEASLGAPAGEHLSPMTALSDSGKVHVGWHKSGGGSSGWMSTTEDGTTWSEPNELPEIKEDVMLKPGRQFNLHASGVTGILGLAPTVYMTSQDEGASWGDTSTIPVADDSMLLAHHIEANQIEGWLHIAWWETDGNNMQFLNLKLVTVEP